MTRSMTEEVSEIRGGFHYGSPASSMRARLDSAKPLPQPAAEVRIRRHYQMPEVLLVDQHGRPTSLRDELQHEGPVLLDFIFTTCPGICPLLSASFARTASLLEDDLEKIRLWSISIDPDYDTPERLDLYSRKFRSPPQWRFFTGELRSIRRVQQAFEADSDNKMAHRALVLLRTRHDTWQRFEGDINPERLVAAVRASLSR